MNAHAAYAAVEVPNNDELVHRHAPLVKRIAYHVAARLPDSILIEDLIQAGMIGLLDAASGFDPSRGASFETYAGIRIRGAIIDEARRSDWTPRSVHRHARELSEAIRSIESSSSEVASPQSVAQEMGVSLDEYYRITADAARSKVLSIDDGDEEHGVGRFDAALAVHAPPDNHYEDQAFKQCLAETIAELPERERLVMSLYYDDELSLREIGSIFGVSESRACQIHGQALVRIRARMAAWTT